MRAFCLLLAVLGLAAIGAADVAPARAATREQASASTEASSQARRRPRVRVYRSTDDRGVIPSYFPGSNAVRDCSVRYVQEFRPSGTVIVPRMNCFWRQP